MLSTFRFVIWVALCASALAATPAQEVDAYISSLPRGGSIFIWPTKTITYEVLSDEVSAAGILASYSEVRRSIVNMSVYGPLPKISVVVVGDVMKDDFAGIVRYRSRMTLNLWQQVISRGFGADGCNAYKFIDRQTWTGLGVVLVESELLPRSITLNDCITAAMDYVNGVPLRDRHFAFGDLPSEPARLLLLEAIYFCSASGETAPRPVERTRSGLTPLPATQCIGDAMGRFRNQDEKLR